LNKGFTFVKKFGVYLTLKIFISCYSASICARILPVVHIIEDGRVMAKLIFQAISGGGFKIGKKEKRG